VGTLPGDSGTIWFEDNQASLEEAREKGTAGRQAKKYRPFGVQWGGQAMLSAGSGGTPSQFALVSCLATVCRELDVEVISSWNVGHPETWGAVGHFKVGGLACDLIVDQQLAELFKLNRDRIAFDDATLEAGVPAHESGEFAPLADVADLVWRMTRKKDEFNHFADMDLQCEEQGTFNGQTLLSLTENKPQNVDPDVWNGFYDAVGAEKRGALPFRVWQMYDAMVGFAQNDDYVEFLCAGGLMAHYVGDACQPLHISKLHHGHPGKNESRVHSVYETAMLDQHAAEMNAAVKEVLKDPPEPPAVKGNGHQAALAVVELMRRTVTRLPPENVIRAYNETHHRTADMWDELGERTAQCLVDGAATLARIWEGAWHEGRQNGHHKALPTTAFTEKELAELYNTKTFVESFTLQEITRSGDKLVPKQE
jgi:hypothetical protein